VEPDFGKMRIAMALAKQFAGALPGHTRINWDNEGGRSSSRWTKKPARRCGNNRAKKKPPGHAADRRTQRHIQVITAATGKIRSYDLVTGKLIWECAGLTRNVILAVADHGLVYCMSGYSGTRCSPSASVARAISPARTPSPGASRRARHTCRRRAGRRQTLFPFQQ